MPGGVGAYRFNYDVFAFESFDNEIVALNLVDGIYYAFGGSAVIAWPYIVGQHSELVIACALAARYGMAADALGRDLSEFVGRLIDEKILLPASATNSGIDLIQLGSLREYQGFSFERHADMEDLLTLDPIHDVDPRKGWPTT